MTAVRRRPPLGEIVRDEVSGRVGEVRGHEGPYVQLRPLGGGREWDAAPARLRPISQAELLSARVAGVNARSRDIEGGPA
ncbi:hypothetical protein [Streptomyces sp. NPDC002851]